MSTGTGGRAAVVRAEQLAVDGIITRAQAVAAGVTDKLIASAVQGRRWQRVLPGVYATSTGRLDQRQQMRAALAWAGSAAVLTGGSALIVRGCRYVEERRPHVLLVRRAAHNPPATILVTFTERPVPRRVRRGLPLAPTDRAAVDALLHLPQLRAARALLCEVVQRDLTTVPALRAEVARRSDRRLTHVARVLEDLEAGCRSAPECELRDLVATSALLPPPQFNLRLAGVGGPEGVIGDAVWPEAHLVAEVDSIEHHGFGVRAEATVERRAQLVAAGWRVIDVTPRRLRDTPVGVLRTLERAYGAGRAAAAARR